MRFCRNPHALGMHAHFELASLLRAISERIKTSLTAGDLSQSAMARLAGANKDYISRIFHSVTGMNYSKRPRRAAKGRNQSGGLSTSPAA